jgi:hypothetical protein
MKSHWTEKGGTAAGSDSSASHCADPEWPRLTFQELLRIAFRDRLVDRLDHPVILRLRGLR